MLNYKDYVKYWYMHGYTHYINKKEALEAIQKMSVGSYLDLNNYKYSDYTLSHNLSEYKNYIFILVGVLSRL